MSNAFIEMDVAPLAANGMPPRFSYEADLSLAAAGNSAAVIIPNGIRGAACTVAVATGGAGKLQTTTDKIYTVKEGSPSWVDWPSGAVSANTSDYVVPVTAIRLVQTSVGGTTQLTIRAE